MGIINLRDRLRNVQDTMTNLVSGLGTTRDKNYHAQWTINLLNAAALETMYRGDWISRKVVDAPAEDATREWRAWQAEKDQIDKIEDAESKLGVRKKLQRAMKMARLYGGGALMLGVEGQGTPDKEMFPDKVTAEQLKFVHPLSCHQLTGASELESDLLSPYFGQPKMYHLHTGIVAVGSTQPGMVQVHPSRIVRLLGRELPDDRSAQVSVTWGDSILQAVEDTLRYAGAVSGNIAALTNEAKIDVIRIPNLSENLSTQEYANRLQTRFTLASQLKSMINTLLLDKEEEWERTHSSFAGLPEVLKMYLLLAAGAADIPATRLLGQSPAGLSSTGESDMRNYYDRVSSDQETSLSPAIERLDEVLVRSALGDRPDEIFYEWNPLWQMTEAEEADIAVKKATVMTADVTAGLIPLPALREGRENQLIEDGTYPGIELSLEEFENEETSAELAMEGQRKLLAAPAPGEEAPDEDEPEPDFGDAGPRRKKLFRKVGSGEYKRIGGKGKTYNLSQVRLLYARGGTWDHTPGGKEHNQKNHAGNGSTDGAVAKRGRGKYDRVGEYEDEDGYKVVVSSYKNKESEEGPQGDIQIISPRGERVDSTSYWMDYPEEGWEWEGKDLAKDWKKNERRGTPEKSLWRSKVPLDERLKMEARHQAMAYKFDSDYNKLSLQFKEYRQARKSARGMRLTPEQQKIRNQYVEKYLQGEIDRVPENEELFGSKKRTKRDSRGGTWDEAAQDADPRTLYVRRDVINSADIVAWARGQGFESVVPGNTMHVTIAFSRTPVDWLKMGEEWGGGEDDEGTLTVKPGGPRMIERLGPQGEAVVLMFASSPLSWRHEHMRREGASWDFPEYQPHVTISWDVPPEFNIGEVEPYRGEIVLGPEIFEEVNENWKTKQKDSRERPFGDLLDEFDPSKHLRHPAGAPEGKGGQFAPKGTTAERVRWRKELKTEQDPAKRKQLKQAIMDSFERHRKRALKNGDTAKAQELEGKLQKYSKIYGIPTTDLGPKTMAQANLGYTPQETKAAESVMASTLGPGTTYTPVEKAHFNDLVHLGGQNQAKMWSKEAKMKLGSAPPGMSPGELSHVVAYTGSGYQSVNAQLRAGVMDEKIWNHVNRLNGALDKFPNHEATVWRRVPRPGTAGMNSVNPALYKPGYIVEERAFTSSAYTPRTPDKNSFIMEIKSLTGKNVSSVSHYPNENEVLFKSSTRFKVLSNDGNLIRMEEVKWVDDQ